MTWDLNFAPLLLQAAGAIEQECTALHSEKLPPVQALRPDDIEQTARLLLRVGEQRKGQRFLRCELVVRHDAVARDADDVCARLSESRDQVAEILRLARASGGH